MKRKSKYVKKLKLKGTEFFLFSDYHAGACETGLESTVTKCIIILNFTIM